MSVLKTYRRLTGERPTSVTYQLDLENKRLGRRMCDSVEAINQAIFLILAVERFDYKIYSYDYGWQSLWASAGHWWRRTSSAGWTKR